ncbi:MAG: hypothetical protein LBN01_00515 [Endomicrobium sp.]|nr:hypothetical protein [Endomicrobium sp.]
MMNELDQAGLSPMDLANLFMEYLTRTEWNIPVRLVIAQSLAEMMIRLKEVGKLLAMLIVALVKNTFSAPPYKNIKDVLSNLAEFVNRKIWAKADDD